MNRPRILILSASVGSGHGRAAQAVELALGDQCPEASVTNIDVLELANPLFRRIYGRGYFGVIKKAPHLIGYLYDRLDQPLRRWEKPVDRMRFGLQGLNLRALGDLLTKQTWDLAISTHFLPAEVIAQLRTDGRIDFPQVIVTTDFDTHRLWYNDPCEHYFTATEEGRQNLSAWGVPGHRITATGIPIHPAFSRPANEWACKRLHGLMDARPVALQLAGGLGIGPIERIHRELLSVEMPLQIVVVTGRNEGARGKIEAIECPPRHRRVVIGFTDRMDELMRAADVIVSKPGGLTTSEALARGAGMIVVDPIPGQETRNSDYLLENGAGMKVNNLASLGSKLGALLTDRHRLEAMRAAARGLARPRAAEHIAEHCLKMLDVRQEQPAAAPGGRRFSLEDALVGAG